MNLKRFFILCSFVIIVCYLFFMNSNLFNISEEILIIESGDISFEQALSEESINLSGEKKNEYDVLVDEDTITFYDKDGNSIIYVFENDRLENVLNVYYLKSKEEAKLVEAYYNSMINNGKIKRVVSNENIVSVVLDMEQFSEYKDYSKSSLEEILINQ